ncbi:MAG TPA: CPBP family intramembrane glutamic endopeptidase, partial [Gemmatimonadaceae bacterium]|nr:CPBP family intramembrane glutamic endopeptidase [Gemmatimonadaceae bacterium]
GDAPGFTATGTALLDLSIVGAAVGVAAHTARPVPLALWQFGLRRGPLGYAIGMAFTVVLAFFIFEIAYVTILQPDNPQTIAEELGADRSTLLLVMGALVVIVVAPVCEELFFRGFLFRVLRSNMPFLAAALIDGVLFGLVHGSFVILPVLAFLGVALCWLYTRTGTLFAPIAVHALNNTIAYGAVTDNGWGVALPMGVAMIVACALVPALLPRRTPAPV